MDQSYHQPTHMPAMLRKLTLITVMLVAILLLAKLLQAVAFAAPARDAPHPKPQTILYPSRDEYNAQTQ